jgi:hypothetical protein
LALTSIIHGATITNNNFARPGESITNNNEAVGDEVIVNNNVPGHKFRFVSRGASHIFQESDCPYGTITNNNQGNKEVICLRGSIKSFSGCICIFKYAINEILYFFFTAPGRPSVINNNN